MCPCSSHDDARRRGLVAALIWILTPKVGDQLHAPAASSPSKALPITIERWCWMSPTVGMGIWGGGRKEKSFSVLAIEGSCPEFFLYIYNIYLLQLGFHPVAVVFNTYTRTWSCTTKFTSGGIHEKPVVATWILGKHLSICFKDTGKPRKKTYVEMAGRRNFRTLTSSQQSGIKSKHINTRPIRYTHCAISTHRLSCKAKQYPWHCK